MGVANILVMYQKKGKIKGDTRSRTEVFLKSLPDRAQFHAMWFHNRQTLGLLAIGEHKGFVEALCDEI